MGATARRLDALRRPASTAAAATRRRWVIVLTGITVLCAVPGLISLVPASAERVDLATLRTQILTTDPEHLGYAESVGALGLPDLPALDDVSSLLGSRTRMRVWHASEKSWRVDVLTGAGERDQYATATGTTSWNYEENLRLDLVGFPNLRTPRPADLLPPALARRLLNAAGPKAALEALPARRVAGVSAAGLRTRPTDPDTTVGAIDVWADPRSGLPVAVEVLGKSLGAADLSTKFLELEQGPDIVAAERLTPPSPTDAQYVVADAPQVSNALDQRLSDTLPNRLAGRSAQTSDSDAPQALRVYGSGLNGFSALPLPPGLDRRIFRAARAGGATVGALDTKTPPPVPGLEGSPQTALIRTPLLTLLILTDTPFGSGSYLFAGSVTDTVLLSAARELVAAEARLLR